MSDPIDRQILKADLLCEDNTEHDYCFPCKEILERIDNQPSAESHDKRTETHACDCVSRQAVQEIVDRIGGMYPYRQIGNRDSYSQYNEAWTDAINRVDAELNSLPSAQTEIIHCKDCKHRPIEKDGEIMPPEDDDERCPCLCDDYFYSWRPKDNFFCASAERRENE